MSNQNILEELFNQAQTGTDAGDNRYSQMGLKFNPFPRSGTTNINGSDIYNQRLFPANDEVKGQILDFISHALSDNHQYPSDKFISATITGNYGSGKTQLLMFVRYILGEVAVSRKGKSNPYVIYIDNPGVKLLEFIGSIISRIGEENLKKFLWKKIISSIDADTKLKSSLSKFTHKGAALFGEQNIDPYSSENSASYKIFLDAFLLSLPSQRQRREFEDTFKAAILQVLEIEVQSSLLAQYFYDLISEDFGVNKTWEALAAGNIKQLDRREAGIIKYIVRLIKEQGYTDFFILVDEFEDITEGRLTKVQVDNYVYNLRTLLDEHREWCLMFAMTGQALRKLRGVSPPLADRITNRLIILQDLNSSESLKIVSNYLSMAQEVPSGISPFDDSAVEELNRLVDGNARRLLKNCFFMVEKAREMNESHIDLAFIKKYFINEDISTPIVEQ